MTTKLGNAGGIFSSLAMMIMMIITVAASLSRGLANHRTHGDG